jgi:hypothetical protein
MRSYLFKVIAFSAGMPLFACTTPVHSDLNCMEWLVNANTNVEALPVEKRYKKVLEEVALGCQALPKALSKAARNSLNQKNAKAKSALLIVLEPYMSNACIQENPSMPASKLLHICNQEDYPDGEFSSIIRNIDAATYLFGSVLRKELKKSANYDPHGKRLLLNFFLSNAVLRE